MIISPLGADAEAGGGEVDIEAHGLDEGAVGVGVDVDLRGKSRSLFYCISVHLQ